MKTTKLFQHRKRSDHKLWKRKRVFLRLQNNLEKLFHAFNYNQALINGTREGFFSHGTIRCETQKQTEWWKCALIVMRQYCKHHWKTVDNLINNLLTNCAGTNSTNFTMILSFYRSKSHSCQNPKKNRFYRVSFLNYPKPGFWILPRIGNTKGHITSTFFNTVHLLPNNLRFERAGATKLASWPGRHLTLLCPWSQILTNIFLPEMQQYGLTGPILSYSVRRTRSRSYGIWDVTRRGTIPRALNHYGAPNHCGAPKRPSNAACRLHSSIQ